MTLCLSYMQIFMDAEHKESLINAFAKHSGMERRAGPHTQMHFLGSMGFKLCS